MILAFVSFFYFNKILFVYMVVFVFFFNNGQIRRVIREYSLSFNVGFVLLIVLTVPLIINIVISISK